MDDFSGEDRSACPGCGAEYDSSGKCNCGYDKKLRSFEHRDGSPERSALASRDWPDRAVQSLHQRSVRVAETLPAIRPEDLDGFRRELRQVLEYELPRWHPLDPVSTWKRRQPKDELNQLNQLSQPAKVLREALREAKNKTEREVLLNQLDHLETVVTEIQETAQDEAIAEVDRWSEALGRPEDLLERLLGPLVWLGARILERAAPKDRPRVAQEFVSYTVPSTATGDTFLEQELANLNPRNFPQRLHSDLKQLLPLFRLLYRGGQAQLEQRVTALLKTEIRKMYLPPALSKTRAGRRLLDALLSEQPREEFKKMLRELELTQMAWARAAGLVPSTVSRLMADQPVSADSLRRLVKVLEKRLSRRLRPLRP